MPPFKTTLMLAIASIWVTTGLTDARGQITYLPAPTAVPTYQTQAIPSQTFTALPAQPQIVQGSGSRAIVTQPTTNLTTNTIANPGSGSRFAQPSFAASPAVPSRTSTVRTGGAGTEMTKILGRMGLSADCENCRSLASQMDTYGVDWVKRNEQAVVNRTISNAEKLGHRMGPVKRAGVRMVVRSAVRRAQ